MSPAVEAQSQEAMDAEQKQKQCFLDKGVMLEPFVHQVGGHSCVLRFGEQTICKPLIAREHQFYRSLPAAMRKFTPQYRGVVSVSFEEDDEGNLCLVAYPLSNDPAADLDIHDLSADCVFQGKTLQWGKKALVDKENRSKDSWSCNSHKDKSVQKLQEDQDVEQVQHVEGLHHGLEHSHSNAAPQVKRNPWSLECHQQHLQRMKENAKHRNQYKFLLLENLTWRQTVPCVLDLKMGTRQHGDDATEEKKALQIRKCQQSTSALIGVRFCGMQVYHPDTDQLIFLNKYQGRKLTVAGFKETLFQFFHSGRRLRQELLSPVLSRLREMQDALEACESYRFYSSSLLIIYDGAPHRKHTRRHTEEGLSEDEEDDEDEETETEVEEEEEAGALGFRHSSSSLSDGGSSCSSGGGGSQPRVSRPERSSPEVDVRMIDFAHTTCRHYGEDSVVHEGQDQGYIFGLQNLISIISELENHRID
ncbi:inositol hexakisphosphate kinase 2 [Oryzias melastigma]|uniref:Kinase n=1 Tax=Oryzias melastigma TaxID=30732 RepID=A0A3B3DQE4_ORYME|nr:inositol hexakisphosphate kinase 2 [Oryzias melastigma]